MRKLIILAASIAALAIPATALANVAVENGVGFVGKGDVQTALDYLNNNTFTDADARSATFTVTTTKSYMAGVLCSTFPGGVSMPEDRHVVNVNMGTLSTGVANVLSSPKISGGKVTGYNLTGIGSAVSTTPDDYSHLNWSAWSTSCPDGESFAGWAYPAANPTNPFFTATTTGDLTVKIGTKTALLPNTPGPTPVV